MLFEILFVIYATGFLVTALALWADSQQDRIIVSRNYLIPLICCFWPIFWAVLIVFILDVKSQKEQG